MTTRRPSRKKKETATFEAMSNLLSTELIKAAQNPSIHAYEPHEKQIRFHCATSRGRLYIGGNRSGKTVGGVVEDVWRLRGKHPYQEVPPAPIRGRIVTTSFHEGVNKVIIPELTRWIPPSDLVNGSWEDSYSKSERMLTLSNGSTVELMSYDQDLDKFAGTSRHFVHFDEEPPKSIFNECRMRLVDTKGPWWITMTPVEGMTWVYEDVYEKGINGRSDITVISIDTTENPYISTDEVNAVMSDLDEDEQKARKQGNFVPIGGRAFKEFSRSGNVIPMMIPPPDWTHYLSMDWGFNAPAAWHWHAVAPNGTVITYDELYQAGWVVPQFVQAINERHLLPNRVIPDIVIGDPSIVQKRGITENDSVQAAFAEHGIYIALGNNDQQIGVEKMNRYLKHRKWFITENNPWLIKSLERQRWKIYNTAKLRHDNPPREELDRKWSHATDSGRYFFTLMPSLFLEPDRSPPVDPNIQIQALLSAGSSSLLYNYRTDPAFNSSAPRTEWTIQDEHMGGIW